MIGENIGGRKRREDDEKGRKKRERKNSVKYRDGQGHGQA